MRRLHAGAGWALVAIGVLHVTVTFVGYETLSLSALWFAGSGLAVVLIGALNVLAATVAREIQAIRAVAAVAGGAGVVLATAFSIVTNWSEPQGPLLLALFAVSTACALWVRVAPSRPETGPTTDRNLVRRYGKKDIKVTGDEDTI